MVFFKSYLTAFLVAVLCFSVSLPAHAASDLQTGKDHFEKGNYLAAFNIFQSLTKRQLGDSETAFLLGRSAFELRDYETAIFSFERVLINQPDADRARLELARSFFEIGDLVSARTNFNRVLAKSPPPTVRQNIERYLKLIDQAAQQHLISGNLSVGLSYDDNVYASPVDEQIQTVLGVFTLSGSGASPQEDLISRNVLQLNHLYRVHPLKPGWLTTFTAYSAVYSDEDDLNLNLVAIGSGPVWQQGKKRTKLQGNINYLTLDGERYLTIVNLAAEQSWPFNKTEQSVISGQLAHLNYASDSRDATQIRVGYSHLWQFKKGSLQGSFSLEKNWAREKEHSYFRPALTVRYQRPLPWQLTGLFGLRLQPSLYDGTIQSFGKARSDTLQELSVGLNRPMWKNPNGTGQLKAQLLGTLIKSHSNIDLYQYDKQVLNFSLSYQF